MPLEVNTPYLRQNAVDLLKLHHLPKEGIF